MSAPDNPKIYRIVHVKRLPSIIKARGFWCDKKMTEREDDPETVIGNLAIKQRRLKICRLKCHTDLFVGDCVPFYFCPRSVMLYVIYMKNHPELSYRGGEGPIVHLVSDLRRSVAWAEKFQRRWAFTLSNAGSSYFEDSNDLGKLDKIDWQAVKAKNWATDPKVKEGKQAEFLMEGSFRWDLISYIGVSSVTIRDCVDQMLKGVAHRPVVSVEPDWYYGVHKDD